MKEPYHNYAYLLDVKMPRGVKDARELSLDNELFRPLRVRMAAPLRFTSWLRLTNTLDFATLVEDLRKDDAELLAGAQKTLATPTLSIGSLDDFKEIVLQNFEIKLGPRKSLDWLNDTARKLLSPLPIRELIVILHLLLPQVTRSNKDNYDCNKEDKTGKQVIAAKPYKLEAYLTPTARGVHEMHETDCKFYDPTLSPAAFVSDYNMEHPWNLYRIAVDKPQTLQRGANAGDVVMMNFSLTSDTSGVIYKGFFIIIEQINRKCRATDNPVANSLRACQADKWKMVLVPRFHELTTSLDTAINDQTTAVEPDMLIRLGQGRSAARAANQPPPLSVWGSGYNPALEGVDTTHPIGLLLLLTSLTVAEDSPISYQVASSTMEASGLLGVHHWALMMPTSSRVPQQVYELLIGVNYPELCQLQEDGTATVGTGTRREDYTVPTGFRFIYWQHDNQGQHFWDGGSRLGPKVTTETTAELWDAVMRHTEDIPVGTDNQTPGLLALTTLTAMRNHLQDQNDVPKRPDNQPAPFKVANVVTLAGATAYHGIIFQPGYGFLSGQLKASATQNQEAVTRATVGLSRAVTVTTIVSPLDMRGAMGGAQVLATLTSGMSRIDTNLMGVTNEYGKVNGQPLSLQQYSQITDSQRIGDSTPPLAIAVLTHPKVGPRLVRMRLILVEAETYDAARSCLCDPRFLPGHRDFGLVWGYALDGNRWPEWILSPGKDGWNLQHVVSKFVYNPRLTFTMEIWALPKYFFFDAWRENPVHNNLGDLLAYRTVRTPIPGGLQIGVYKQTSQPKSRIDRTQSSAVDFTWTNVSQNSVEPGTNEETASVVRSKEVEWKAAEEAIINYALLVHQAKVGQGEAPEALSLDLLATVSPEYPLARLQLNLTFHTSRMPLPG
eukprot:s455_g5.t1